MEYNGSDLEKGVLSYYLEHGERILKKSKRIKKKIQDFDTFTNLLNMGDRTIDRMIKSNWLGIISNIRTSDADYRKCLHDYLIYMRLVVIVELKEMHVCGKTMHKLHRANRQVKRVDVRIKQLMTSNYFKNTFDNHLSKLKSSN